MEPTQHANSALAPSTAPAMPRIPTTPTFKTISNNLNDSPFPPAKFVSPVTPTPLQPPPPELPKPPATLPPAPKHSWGPFVGIIIIVLVLIVGALYFWGAKLEREQQAPIDSTMPALDEGGSGEMLVDDGIAQ